jgi:hypothetical protein
MGARHNHLNYNGSPMRATVKQLATLGEGRSVARKYVNIANAQFAAVRISLLFYRAGA